MRALTIAKAPPIKLSSTLSRVLRNIGKIPGVLTAKNAGWRLETFTEINGLPMVISEDRRTGRRGALTSSMTIGLMLRAPDDIADVFRGNLDSSIQIRVGEAANRSGTYSETCGWTEGDTGNRIGLEVYRVLYRNGRSAHRWMREVEAATQKLVADAPEVKQAFDGEMAKLRELTK